jgi:hypothetical protein
VRHVQTLNPPARTIPTHLAIQHALLPIIRGSELDLYEERGPLINIIEHTLKFFFFFSLVLSTIRGPSFPLRSHPGVWAQPACNHLANYTVCNPSIHEFLMNPPIRTRSRCSNTRARSSCSNATNAARNLSCGADNMRGSIPVRPSRRLMHVIHLRPNSFPNSMLHALSLPSLFPVQCPASRRHRRAVDSVSASSSTERRPLRGRTFLSRPFMFPRRIKRYVSGEAQSGVDILDTQEEPLVRYDYGCERRHLPGITMVHPQGLN